MEKSVKHRFLNNAFFTALVVPSAFFLLRDTVAFLTELLLKSVGAEGTFLYLINDDVARLVIAELLMLIMPVFFRGRCGFGFKGGKTALGFYLALPLLIVPAWNLLQIKVYDAPLVTGAAALAAAVVHGIGPGVSEEVFLRGFVVSNLMRIKKDKPNGILDSMLISGAAFGLLHAVNIIATGDVLATVVQVIYTTAVGMMSAAVFLRSRSIWGVILMHTLTDVTAFVAVFDGNVSGMDIAFCVFGSLLFVALALYLIRPAKRAEIDALWEDGWSFGDEDGKRHAGAKAAAIVSAVLAALFTASLGITIYQAKMGYDTPLFPAGDKGLDENVQYRIDGDGKELTILLPCGNGEEYVLENSAPDALVLKESSKSGEAYAFVFTCSGSGTEKAELVFSMKLGNAPTSLIDYTVTVSFTEDGRISGVGG